MEKVFVFNGNFFEEVYIEPKITEENEPSDITVPLADIIDGKLIDDIVVEESDLPEDITTTVNPVKPAISKKAAKL